MTLENCGSTQCDLVLLRECSYCTFGCFAEVARGRAELAHRLSLPSLRGKKPPALHDSSSDPTTASLKPRAADTTTSARSLWIPQRRGGVAQIIKGNVWKRLYIRSLASWTRRESVLGLSGFFDDTKLCPWLLLTSLNSLFHIRFANIPVFYCWLLMLTVFFFYSQDNLQSTLEIKCWLSSRREQRGPSRLRSKRPDVRRALS